MDAHSLTSNGPEYILNPLRRLVEARFEIVEELADEALEAIFLARHRELGDRCVVKVLRHTGLERDDHKEFFRRRLPWLTRLSLEGVGRVHDVRLESGFALIEMEPVPGRAADAVLADAVAQDEDAPLPLGLALDLVDQCAAIVGRLHGEEWVHGSLSPAKFLVHEADDALEVRLVEPGVARLLPGGDRTTAGGMLARRLRYTAPERFLDARAELQPPADLYAVGLLAYELLTGRYPISGESATALAAGHLMRPPLGFDQSDPRGRLPQPLRDLLLRTLAKEPERRPESTAELRRELAEIRRGLPTEPASPFGTYDMTRARDEAVRRAGDATEDADPEPTGAEAKVVDRAQVKAQVRRAREAVTESDYTAAIDSLREGLRLAPDEPKLVELLRQVEGAARRQRDESKRRRSLDDEVRSIRALMEGGDGDAARERLDDAEERLGGDARLDELRRELGDGESGEDDAESLVAEAERLSRTEDFTAAREALRRAREIDPEHSRARTLSESVEALVELGRQESERRLDVEEAMDEIRAHLAEGRPSAAMSKLNRAVVRYGDLEELQALRYEVATAFLEEDAAWEGGDATHAPPPEPLSSAPPPSPPSSPPPAPISSPSSAPSSPTSSHSAEDDEEPEPDLGTVDRIALAGLGGDTGEFPSGRTPEAPEVKSISPWLDLRDPRGWLVLLLVLALVAYLGYWIATRTAGGDEGPQLETEDVQGPAIRWSAGVSAISGQPLEAQTIHPPVGGSVGVDVGVLQGFGVCELHEIGSLRRADEDGVHRLLRPQALQLSGVDLVVQA